MIGEIDVPTCRLEYSPSGNLLAATSYSGEFHVWKLEPDGGTTQLLHLPDTGTNPSAGPTPRAFRFLDDGRLALVMPTGIAYWKPGQSQPEVQTPFPEAIPTGSPITIASDGSKYLATFGNSLVLVNVATGSVETLTNTDWKNFRIRFNNTLNYYAFCESGAQVVRLHDHKIVQHIPAHNPQVLEANMTSGRLLRPRLFRGRYDFESGRYFAELRGLPFMRPNGDLQTYVEGRVVDYVREPPKSTDIKAADEAYLEKRSISLEQFDGYGYFNWTGDGNKLWSVARDALFGFGIDWTAK